MMTDLTRSAEVTPIADRVMTSLIINLPHLQSRRQRLGALLFSALGWLYFLVPALIVGGWLIGLHKLAKWVVWLGGFSHLRAMVSLTGQGIASLALAWGLWTLYLALRPAIDTDKPARIDDFSVSRHFRVARSDVEAARRARITTVHFAASGQIIAIEPEVAHGAGAWPARVSEAA